MKGSLKILIKKMMLTSDEDTLFAFFKDQFNRIQINDQVDRLTFHNYIGLPCLLSKKLFHALNKENLPALTQDCFARGLTMFYSDSLLTRLRVLFQILDFKRRDLIQIEDVKFYLLHLHLINNQSNVTALLDQVDLMFNKKTEMNFVDFLEIASKKTSDIILLLLFLMNHYHPIEVSSIDYYHKVSYEGVKAKSDPMFHRLTNFNNHQQKRSKDFKFIEPSRFLYDYLKMNYDEEFDLCEEQETISSCDDDDEDDLHELLEFEEDLKEVTRSAISTMSSMTIHINHSIKQHKSNTILHESHELNDFHQEKFGSNIPYIKNNSHHLSHINFKQFNDTQNPLNLIVQSLIVQPPPSSSSFYCKLLNENGTQHKCQITINGNMLFILKRADSNNNVFNNRYTFSEAIVLRQVYIYKKDNEANDDSLTLILISTVKGCLEQYILQFARNDALSVEQFITVIHAKTNFRCIEDDYEILHIIGSGSSGTVKFIKKKSNGERYAVKILPINYKSREDLIILTNELDICKLLSKTSNTKSNIVQFYDYYKTIDHIYIIMEFIPGYSLNTFLKMEPIIIQANLKSIISQIITSIKTLFFYGIIHRDIKSENIMISANKDSKDYKITLIDFGFAKVISQSEKLEEFLGTVPFTSPEIVLNQKYSIQTDIWSFGVILYQLLHGELPFIYEGDDIDSIMCNIIEEPIQVNVYNKSMNQIDNVIQKMISMCLEKNSDIRSSIYDINALWSAQA